MKDGDIQGRVTEVGYRNYARSKFLQMMVRLDVRPMTSLRDEVYRIYVEVGANDHLNPFSKIPVAERKHAQRKLSRAIEVWQNKWDLVESDDSEKWIEAWAINCVFKHWSCSSKFILERLMFLPIECSDSNEIPPVFRPEPFAVHDRFTNLSFIPYYQDEYIDRACKALRKHLGPYCKKIESRYAERGLGAFKKIAERDLIWAVSWQITRESFASLGTYPDKLYSEKNKNRHFIDPKNVDPITDIEFKHFHKSTVLRAVHKILKVIGIRPRTG